MQCVVASESDQYPMIQMWDLRNTRSPIMELQGHTQGILSCNWCPWDETLLVSAGKDKTVLSWNTTTGACEHRERRLNAQIV